MRAGRSAGRATIDDVARAAGVSHQTVSNVVHNRGRVGAGTRARVQAVIDTLGYRPHDGAVSLRTRRTGRIAYSLPSGELTSRNPVMVEFTLALTALAAEHGQRLLLATDVTDLHDLFSTGTADAAILATVAAPDDPRVVFLAEREVPFAAFGRTAPGLPQSWVDVDNRAALARMTRRVAAAGPVFLGYEPQGRWDIEREAGYRDVMAGDAVVRHAPPDPDGVRRTVDALLDSSPGAVVTGSDMLAAAVYLAATGRGLRVGADLAVTGFDGSVAGRLLTPALTTLVIPMAEVARLLLQRVLAELTAPTGAPGQMIEPLLVVGESG